MNNLTAKIRKVLTTSALAASLAVAPTAFAGNNDHYQNDSKLKDAWIDGKVESALLVNRHLNNFTIDTDVKNGTAYLSGTVRSDIDKDLATEIAKSIDGVENVENTLVVKAERPNENKTENAERNFGTWYDDSTTTAAIKSKLLWNGETDGLDVNIDTMYGVVTIRGDVSSSEEKQLIEKIAMNTDGVKEVKNMVRIEENS